MCVHVQSVCAVALDKASKAGEEGRRQGEERAGRVLREKHEAALREAAERAERLMQEAQRKVSMGGWGEGGGTGGSGVGGGVDAVGGAEECVCACVCA